MSRWLRRGMGAVAALAGAAAVYATLLEPRWLQRTRTLLHFRDLPDALEGLRVALITDLHANGLTPRSLPGRAVRAVMQEQPHLIAVTGDLAETGTLLERTLDQLAELHAPLGVYLVPGNHDHRDVGIQTWHAAVARRPSLTDLTNAARILEIDRGRDGFARLCVAGVDDLAEGAPSLEALPPLAERDFTILLAHQPDQAEQARRATDDVDLILSGHTHGGQVRIPGIGAVVNSAANPALYEAGVRRRPWTQVYTSRGIGTVHVPVRLFTRPEVAILTLTAAPREDFRLGSSPGTATGPRPMRRGMRRFQRPVS